MRYVPIIAALILSAFITDGVQAQQQLFKNYTVNDGLVANSIRRIFQDKNGFLWIGTWEGLSKYDGHSFSNFTTGNGLSHNLVNDLFDSGNGGIYVALNNGSIDHITSDGHITKSDSSHTIVNSITKMPWNKIIATTDNNGLQEFSNGQLTSVQKFFPGTTYTHVQVLDDTSFFAAGEGFLTLYNKQYVLLAETSKGYNKYSDVRIFRDSKKRIWVGSSEGLRMLAPVLQKNTNIHFMALPPAFNITSLTNTKINDIFEDKDSILWFATTSGLVKINSDGASRVITVKDGLSSNIVNTIFQDKENNIWFGTELGLSKLVTASGISLYPIKNGITSSDNTFLVHPFKKNTFLVSTSTGVAAFNTSTGQIKPVVNKNIFYAVPNSSPPLFLGDNALFSLDTGTLQLKKTNELPGHPYSRVMIDRNGHVFSSDINQLFFISGKKMQMVLNERIAAMLFDKNGDLWAGSWNNGLYRIRYIFADTGLVIKALDHFLPEKSIRCLLIDRQGNMWAGTRYNGVMLLAQNEKGLFSVSKFDQSNGLTSNFIKQVKEDVQGNFWLASKNGLDKLIRTKNGFRVFNFSRINNYFAWIIGIETGADNILWVATNEGMVKIKDTHMERWLPLPVYITRVATPDSLFTPSTSGIELNYHQNQVQFGFSAPGYINEKQVLYSYRLTGSNPTEWSAASDNHVVSYASLQPAAYQFEVRALGYDGNWGKPAVFHFTITPPFYKTWWFLSALVLCTGLLIYFLVRWRIKNIKMIAGGKIKVQQLKAEQYRNQLELEQIVNYISASLVNKNNVDSVLKDVAKNIVDRLGLMNCSIFLWNESNTKMVLRVRICAGDAGENTSTSPVEVLPGQGAIGHVMISKQAVRLPDTNHDNHYDTFDINSRSVIAVPVVYNNELIAIISSEHPGEDFYTSRHGQALTVIAALIADKIKSIEAEQILQQAAIKIYSINEQLTKAKLDALQSQMNPHFIFNCLNSIDNLIQMDEKEKATVYLSKFAKLLRSILENASGNAVPIWKDIETLKLYLELETLRFSNKFCYRIIIHDDLLNSDYKVPSLLIQPFVENAIHHGLLSKKEGEKHLNVTVSIEGDSLKYSIEDNGVGRLQAAEYKALNKPAYRSMGIQITGQRINLFNPHNNGAVKITDLKDAAGNALGTRVDINLHIQS